MREYNKINTIYKRDERGKIMQGEWSLPEFKYLADVQWTYMEKVDGMNLRIGWNGEKREIGGRTNNASIPAFLFDKLLTLFPEEKLQAVFPKMGGSEQEIILFGEGYGPKIQKGGGNYRSDVSFVLFDIMIGDWILQRSDVEDIATKLGIDIVPIIGTGTLFNMHSLVEAGLKSQWGDFMAEGIVARPAVELKNRRGDRIICKLKTKDFTKV